MIRILIADDQSLFREALRTLLSVQNDFEVIAEACNGEEALRLAVQHRPDVVLMDLRMPVMDGITATRRLHSVLDSCRVIVLTTFDEDEDVLEALRSGAVGYLLKDVTSEKLYEAIRLASRGEYVLHPTITAKVISHIARTVRPVLNESATLVEPLSPREIEILRLVATAASNKEIADQLVIAEGTVKNHMRNILSKLGVKDRLQAVLKAKELGII